MNTGTIERLQDLIRINIDSVKGFEQAAEAVEDQHIATTLRGIARDRRDNAARLREFVQMTNEEAEDSGSIKGTAHRWWLRARAAISGGDTHAVLSEAERGEDAMTQEYQDALKIVDDPGARRVVSDQFAQISQAHEKVRELRNSHART